MACKYLPFDGFQWSGSSRLSGGSCPPSALPPHFSYLLHSSSPSCTSLRRYPMSPSRENWPPSALTSYPASSGTMPLSLPRPVRSPVTPTCYGLHSTPTPPCSSHCPLARPPKNCTGWTSCCRRTPQSILCAPKLAVCASNQVPGCWRNLLQGGQRRRPRWLRGPRSGVLLGGLCGMC